MAQMTAVEWLLKYIEPSLTAEQKQFFSIVIPQSKELEKQQHGNTWDSAIKAHDDRGHVHARSLVDFDEYYNDTFKK